MRAREGERKKMRHSSSWPDRAPQTVKVRVDPLSRAFTIIPAIGGRLHPLLTGSTSNWIDEIVLLDHGGSSTGSSVEAKRRFVDGTRAIEWNGHDDELGESLELRALLPDVMNESCGTAVNSDGRGGEARKSEGKLPSGASSSANPRDPDDPDDRQTSERGSDEGQRERNETANSRTRSRKEKERSSFESSTAARKQMIGEDGWNRRDASPPPFEAIVRAEAAGNRLDETGERSIGRRAANPQIEVVDYDDTTTSHPARMKHACPKCTSEGLLRERVDPFRSPVSSRKSVAGRGDKPETGRKYSTGEGKMRNSWRRIGARGLIGGGRNKEKSGRRNPVLCRPINDVRKEATLRRHYYPEGGWGYVIVTCSALVHFLGIGLQLAAPGSWYLTAELVFHQPALHSAGNFNLFFSFSLSISSSRVLQPILATSTKFYQAWLYRSSFRVSTRFAFSIKFVP